MQPTIKITNFPSFMHCGAGGGGGGSVGYGDAFYWLYGEIVSEMRDIDAREFEQRHARIGKGKPHFMARAGKWHSVTVDENGPIMSLNIAPVKFKRGSTQ